MCVPMHGRVRVHSEYTRRSDAHGSVLHGGGASVVDDGTVDEDGAGEGEGAFGDVDGDDDDEEDDTPCAHACTYCGIRNPVRKCLSVYSYV